MVTLLGASEIRALAAELDVTPTKKWGQNFVHDANTVRKIVAASNLESGAAVLEVGPGLGSLTLGLLEAGHPVTAIEIDPRLAARLPKTATEHGVPAGQFTVINQDALTVTELPVLPTALVANLPYNISVPVIIHLLTQFPSIQRVLVMVQAEVGHRLAADPGSKVYGVPSVKASWWGDWSIAGTVSRQVFWPVPNVDSALVAMTGHETPGDEALRRRTLRWWMPRSVNVARPCVRHWRPWWAAPRNPRPCVWLRVSIRAHGVSHWCCRTIWRWPEPGRSSRE